MWHMYGIWSDYYSKIQLKILIHRRRTTRNGWKRPVCLTSTDFSNGLTSIVKDTLADGASIAMCLGDLYVLRLDSTEALFDAAEIDGCAECDIVGWRIYTHQQIDGIRPYTSFT